MNIKILTKILLTVLITFGVATAENVSSLDAVEAYGVKLTETTVEKYELKIEREKQIYSEIIFDISSINANAVSNILMQLYVHKVIDEGVMTIGYYNSEGIEQKITLIKLTKENSKTLISINVTNAVFIMLATEEQQTEGVKLITFTLRGNEETLAVKFSEQNLPTLRVVRLTSQRLQ